MSLNPARAAELRAAAEALYAYGQVVRVPRCCCRAYVWARVRDLDPAPAMIRAWLGADTFARITAQRRDLPDGEARYAEWWRRSTGLGPMLAALERGEAALALNLKPLLEAA